VSGCSGDTDFTITRTYRVQTTALAFGPDLQAVDLSKEMGEAWKYRDDLTDVKVTSVTAIAHKVVAPADTFGSGSAVLDPDGDPTTLSGNVLMGEWTNVRIAEGSWIQAGGNDALDQAVEDALHGNGLVWFALQGSATAEFSADVEVVVKGTVDYKISIWDKIF
jgi:hypothetical protein